MSTCRIQWATRTLTPNRISTNRLRSLHKALPQAQRTGRTHRTRIRMRPQITPATVPRTLGKGLTPLEVPCLPSNPVPATDSLHQNQTKRGKRARPTRPGPLLTGPGKHPAPILRVRGLLSLVARSTKKKKARTATNPSWTGPRSPRGTAPAPSRKPKQSGHALWVGNLPPGTNVVDLKDHFARDATHDIESVFLISKSNCAFVNYKTEESCTAAAARFHDSWFQGARLVCRIRRGFAGPGTGAHQGSPHAGAGPRQGATLDKPEEDSSDARERQQGSAVSTAPRRVPERYFIVKSLTVEDLEWSRHIGIWTTQIHNEAILNQAYEVCPAGATSCLVSR